MRLFVALPLPAPARRAIGTLIDEVAAVKGPVRWVPEASLHITLKFLGETAETQMAPLTDALHRTTVGTSPLAVTATEIGGFPVLRRARVIWMGLDGPPALELLAHRVAQECDGLGFPPEAKVFHPHVTLGRVRDGGRLTAELLGRLEGLRPVLSFALDTLVLFASRSGSGGAAYTPLASFPLTN